MKRSWLIIGLTLSWAAFAAAAWLVPGQLVAAGAGALIYPVRQHVDHAPPETCGPAEFAGAGVQLRGWRCRASGEPRGTIVYLHGVGDTRASGAGIIERFVSRGFDLVAYDSRAHGESGGDVCTYGFFEKEDLRRVLDALEHPGPVVLMGSSLGAAVALQEAADDARVRVVVAAETFSDLRTVAIERAPFVFTQDTIRKAFLLAEERGHFKVDEVSPERSAARITVPVLLIHGAADRETPADHSRRVFAALMSKKRIIIVPGAGHNGSLTEDVWIDVERWIDDAMAPRMLYARRVVQ